MSRLTIFSLAISLAASSFIVFELTCYRRLINGRRLNERFIRHSLPCDSLEACQHQCSVEKHFNCQGFNIRLDRRGGGGVCELTAIPSNYLDSTTDFLYEPEFDYYEKDKSNESPNCGYVNEIIPSVVGVGRQGPQPATPVRGGGGPYYGGDSYGPWSTGHGNTDLGPWGPHGYGGGYYLTNNPSRGPPPPVLTSLTGGGLYGPLYYSPLSNEIAEPVTYRGKVRGFREGQGRSYEPQRVPFPPVGSYVIIDASPGSPHREQQQQRHQLQQQQQPQQARWQHGRAMAPYNYDNYDNYNNYNSIDYTDNQVCFQRAHPGQKLSPSCVRAVGQVSNILTCEEMCLKAHFRCVGYSFRYSDQPDDEPNCALTDLSDVSQVRHNLQPDRSCDVYVKMPSCLDTHSSSDTECFSKVGDSLRMETTVIRSAMLVPGIADCELACLKAALFTCRSFTVRYSSAVIGDPEENCFLSDWPITALQRTDLAFDRGYQVYERGSYGHGCELDSGPPYIGPQPPTQQPNYPWNPHPHPTPDYNSPGWPRQETWQHYTVRGWPCRAGSSCQLNKDVGFWSCEVEGGDHKQWDYCCRPRHSCGYSKGYNYPWCYVGEAGPDQWRPCSEKYYPLHRPSGNRGNRDGRYDYRPVDGSQGGQQWTYSQDELDPPSYWPISYLYAEPPPNETDYHAIDEAPRIKFKETPAKVSYPKAIVHKLDFKDKLTVNPGDPGADAENVTGLHLDLQTVDKVTDDDVKFILVNSGRSKHKGSLERLTDTTKIGQVPFTLSENSSVELVSGKREIANKTDCDEKKVKDVIRKVEELIAQTNETNLAKDGDEVDGEMLKRSSRNSVHAVHTRRNAENASESAIDRFWNWGQQRYSQQH